jgi:hypothetical protein
MEPLLTNPELITALISDGSLGLALVYIHLCILPLLRGINQSIEKVSEKLADHKEHTQSQFQTLNQGMANLNHRMERVEDKLSYEQEASKSSR